MGHCPTPNKRRFATFESASMATSYSAIGTVLEPYFCAQGCQWWHLTTVNPLPAPDPEVIQELLDMEDSVFLEVVSEDTRGYRNPARSAALRDRALLGRWRKALSASLHDIDQQFKMRNEEGAKDKEWKRRIMSYKTGVEGRRRECLALIDQLPKIVRDALRHVPQNDKAALRAVAGEEAVKLLIIAHRVEFYGYLAEACKEIGVEPPERVSKLLAKQAEEVGE
jgi:hypothetical protein